MSGSPPFLDHCGPLLADYDVVLCDVWGVIHNGVESFPAACAALRRARGNGKTVLLISNSPRPAKGVVPQLDGLRVPRDWLPDRPDGLTGDAQLYWLRLRIVHGRYEEAPVFSFVLQPPASRLQPEQRHAKA